MAILSRNNDAELVLALAYALNAQQSDFTDGYADGYFHRDLTQTTNGPLLNLANIVLTNVSVSAATATNLATTITLANQIFGVLNLHMQDDQVHLKADGVNLSVLDGYASILASDLPSVQVLLNAVKVVFNDHLTQSGVHQINDTVNTVVAANATNLSTSETLANALKSSLNTHMNSAPTGAPRIRIVST